MSPFSGMAHNYGINELLNPSHKQKAESNSWRDTRSFRRLLRYSSASRRYGGLNSEVFFAYTYTTEERFCKEPTPTNFANLAPNPPSWGS